MSVRRTLLVMVGITVVMPVGAGLLRAGPAMLASQAIDTTLPPAPALTAQRTYTITGQPVAQTVSALGTVEANATYPLSFQTSGEIAEVLVTVGASVMPGDVLLRLDQDMQRIDYAQAVQNLERAQIALRELKEPVNENDLRIAQADLDSAHANYNAVAGAVSAGDLHAAELRYQQAQDAYQAQVDARRIMNGNENEIALQDAAIGAASFEMEIARLKLEDLQRGNPFGVMEANARIRQAELAVEQVQAGPTQAQIIAAEIAIQRAAVQLQEAEIALARTELVAPSEGMIFYVNTKLGRAVNPGATVIEVTDTSSLWVTVQVDETDIDRIRPGMAATIHLDALPNLGLAATVDRIALLGTEEDGVMYFETRLRLDDVDPRVRVGMTAEAFIELDTTEQLAIVPNEYIRIEDNQAFVDVLNADNTITAVRITLGAQGLDTTQVRSGIAPGDVLVQGTSA